MTVGGICRIPDRRRPESHFDFHEICPPGAGLDAEDEDTPMQNRWKRWRRGDLHVRSGTGRAVLPSA